MCGITGYTGHRKASGVVLGCLRRLEYRGYDSCGIASIGDSLHLRKDAGMIDEIEERLSLSELPGKIAIGHTRWATHGKVCAENAHPHLDCSGEIAVVHNGIISNFKELREELEGGHSFASQTDSEVLVHLIEDNYRSSLEGAVVKALEKIEGTYAVLAISAKEPGKVVAARSESPLLIGVGDGENFVGSDISAFLPYTREVVPLDDMEYAVITPSGVEVKSLEAREPLEKEALHVDWSESTARKEGYSHFMLKEIHEQPSTVAWALSTYHEEVEKLAGAMAKAGKVYLTGAGTSLYACEVAEYWFSTIADELVVAVDSSELESRAVVDSSTLVLAVTQSGETYDTLAAMRAARSRGAETGVVVNVIGSTATRMAEYVVMQNSGIETSVAATKTYTSQLALLLRLAIELARLKGRKVEHLEEELYTVRDKIAEVLGREEEFERCARSFFNVGNYLFIGKGLNLATAKEAALKLKEITYLHAEGMSSGLLKHGTISLIDQNMNTVAFLPSGGRGRERMLSNIQEVRAREGRVLVLSQGEGGDILLPESSEPLSPFIFAPAFQLLAYHVALKLGRDVDRPRALAKSVTVE